MPDPAAAPDPGLPLPPPGGPLSPAERVFLGLDGGWPLLGSVTTLLRRSPGELDTRGLVALLKHRHPGAGPLALWDKFVEARMLRPEIDLKRLTELAGEVRADPQVLPLARPFSPQWYDPDRGALLQTSAGRPGVVDLVWSDGGYGSSPAYLRGRYEIERLALLPRGGPRYAAARDGRVEDRWGGGRLGPFRSAAAAGRAAGRLNSSNALRWASAGLALPG